MDQEVKVVPPITPAYSSDHKTATLNKTSKIIFHEAKTQTFQRHLDLTQNHDSKFDNQGHRCYRHSKWYLRDLILRHPPDRFNNSVTAENKKAI